MHDGGSGLGVQVHDHAGATAMQVQDATGRDGLFEVGRCLHGESSFAGCHGLFLLQN